MKVKSISPLSCSESAIWCPWEPGRWWWSSFRRILCSKFGGSGAEMKKTSRFENKETLKFKYLKKILVLNFRRIFLANFADGSLHPRPPKMVALSRDREVGLYLKGGWTLRDDVWSLPQCPGSLFFTFRRYDLKISQKFPSKLSINLFVNHTDNSFYLSLKALPRL